MKTLKEIFGGFNKPKHVVKEHVRPTEKTMPEKVIDRYEFIVGPPVKPMEVSVHKLDALIPHSDFEADYRKYTEDVIDSKVMQFTMDAAIAWRNAVHEMHDKGVERIGFDEIRAIAQRNFAARVIPFIDEEIYNSVNIFNEFSEIIFRSYKMDPQHFVMPKHREMDRSDQKRENKKETKKDASADTNARKKDGVKKDNK